MLRLKYLIIVIGLSVYLAGCEGNQKNTDRSGDTTTTGDSLVGGDQNRDHNMGVENDFVINAASAGLMEVELGKIAQKKAKSADVKNFAQMMVTDHTKSNAELKAVAQKLNLTLPDSMMNKHRDMVEDMNEVKAEDFDKEYIDMMVEDHKEDISDFENASKEDARDEVKQFASKTLPVLRKHHERAKAISEKIR